MKIAWATFNFDCDPINFPSMTMILIRAGRKRASADHVCLGGFHWGRQFHREVLGEACGGFLCYHQGCPLLLSAVSGVEETSS
jgi:hypothetical protein